MTLPVYQKHGYGRFLIEFSYLLSKRENMPGTPEKPLSDLGRISYESFWKSKILFYIKQNLSDQITVEALSKATGFNVHDIGATLQRLNLIRYHRKSEDGSAFYEIAIDPDLLTNLKQPKISVNEEALRWTPLVAYTNGGAESDVDVETSTFVDTIEVKSGPVGEDLNKTGGVESLNTEKKKKRRRRWNKTGYNNISRNRKRKSTMNGAKNKEDEQRVVDEEDVKKTLKEAEEGDDEDEGDDDKSPYYEPVDINSSTEADEEDEQEESDQFTKVKQQLFDAETSPIKNEAILENGHSTPDVPYTNGFTFDSEEETTKSN